MIVASEMKWLATNDIDQQYTILIRTVTAYVNNAHMFSLGITQVFRT